MCEVILERELEQIKEKVNCVYLGAVVFPVTDKDLMEKGMSPLQLVCHNVLCGPKFECDVYNGKACKYHSDSDDKFLDSKQPGYVPF